MEMIQNAYAGFAKGNMTMLDNLKLGYGGTQSEMQRLIKDAAALDSSIDANSMSFANIVKAINVVQTEMGITGTTALEAGRTISGSVGSMKSAWTNLITGLADGNADIGQLVDNLVTTIVGDGTEGNLGVIGNILPAVKTALNGSAKLVEEIFPEIIGMVPEIIEDTLPQILSSGINVIKSILAGIASNPDEIIDTVFSVIDTLISGIEELLPDIIVTGALLLGKLAAGIVSAIPDLVLKIPEIIGKIVDGFSKNAGEFTKIGENIVNGIWQGLKNVWYSLTNWFSNAWDGLVGGVKDLLGIHSPSRVFAGIGKNMALGVGEGWEDEFGDIQNDIDKSLAFDDPSIGINASIRKVGAGAAGGAFGGTSIGNIIINIDGAKYSDEQRLASAIALEIQNMTDRRAAVYA